MRVQSPARLPGELLPLLLLFSLPTLVHAQFNYVTNADDTITITGFTGGDTAYIPSTINGLPVTSIGDSAFCVENRILVPAGTPQRGGLGLSFDGLLPDLGRLARHAGTIPRAMRVEKGIPALPDGPTSDESGPLGLGGGPGVACDKSLLRASPALGSRRAAIRRNCFQ
jgi:hypothetical protein